MRIAVYGAGGVGGYFGGRLALSGLEVVLIARGRHLVALQEDGLRVRSVRGDFTVPTAATSDPSTVGPCDYVLFCVKSFDTDAAAAHLEPLLQPKTAVVSLQNGVDNEEKLIQALGESHVMGGVAYIFAGIEEPGVIRHTGGPTSIAFGELDGRESRRAVALLERCRDAGFGVELTADVITTKWTKFAFICALAGMTAASRRPIGEIVNVESSWSAFVQIFDEVAVLAAAEGRPLPAEARERSLGVVANLERNSFSSLYDDMVHGRRMELEALHGEVVRRAKLQGIPAPMCEAIYAVLKPSAVNNGS